METSTYSKAAKTDSHSRVKWLRPLFNVVSFDHVERWWDIGRKTYLHKWSNLLISPSSRQNAESRMVWSPDIQVCVHVLENNSNKYSSIDTDKCDIPNIGSDQPEVTEEIPSVLPVKNAPRKVRKNPFKKPSKKPCKKLDLWKLFNTCNLYCIYYK